MIDYFFQLTTLPQNRPTEAIGSFGAAPFLKYRYDIACRLWPYYWRAQQFENDNISAT